ncbi:hypothetical protein SAMN04489761_0087 [Tenacibaculum sp. MAR_2009_124]|uniref:hypothetical protein n=1 Tax=Tenacibaculum sp. MAR_2009_124 TaxID=1250059 RepID=UPI00089C2457|nr:hypothetical protein [Tenacibaculum sp. MAR_2009_124]SEB35728.1 hypothetical protein SAMN04489761_0087 [Tenacibaculum sp. MAR_2009_124]
MNKELENLKQQFLDLFIDTNEISNETLLEGLRVPLKVKNINDYEMGKMKRDICKQLSIIK